MSCLAWFVDALVICGLSLLFNRGETKGLGLGFVCAVLISLAGYAVIRILGPLGVPLLLGGVPLLAFFVFWAVFELPPLRAIGAAAIYLVYLTSRVVLIAMLVSQVGL